MRRKQAKDRELLGDTSSRDVSLGRAVRMATNKLALSVTFLLAFTVAVFVAGVWQIATPLLLASALGAAVLVQIVNPGFWRRLRELRVDPAPVLPDPDEAHDPSVAGLVQRLRRARHTRARAASRSPYGVRHALARSQAAVSELERRAIVLIARAEYVSTFLAELSDAGAPLESEIVRLRSAEQGAPCVEASAAYRQASRWSIHRRDAVRRLEAKRATLVGALEHVVTMLETMPAKVTDLEMRRMDDCDQLLGLDVVEAEQRLAQLDAPLPEVADGPTAAATDGAKTPAAAGAEDPEQATPRFLCDGAGQLQGPWPFGVPNEAEGRV
jgi:hypothetical protein